ncbi:MAG: translation elongation factor Ts [Planctomycetota bacterium]
MAITAAQVKELRDKTGIPMMKCKKALQEADGDIDAAIEILRKQGLETASKKAGRATAAGGIGIAINDSAGVLVSVACETDFVSSNEEFKAYVQRVADVALESGASDIDALAQADMGGQTVAEGLTALIAKLGENMKLVDIKRLEGAGIVSYSHGGRIATLIAGSGDEEARRHVAMHVAAANPPAAAFSRDEVDAAMLERERQVIASSDEVMAKPEAIREKIVEGKLGRFYKEQVLLEQDMLLYNDDNLSVEKWAAGKGVKLHGFLRMDV